MRWSRKGECAGIRLVSSLATTVFGVEVPEEQGGVRLMGYPETGPHVRIAAEMFAGVNPLYWTGRNVNPLSDRPPKMI